MICSRRIGTAVLVLLLVACGSTPKVPEGSTAEDVFRMAADERARGNAKGAIDLFEQVYTDYPSSGRAEEAQWLAAETAIGAGRHERARDILKDYHEVHPVARLAELGDRMYVIGEELYKSGQSGLFGTGIFPSASAAYDTMTWITEKLRNGSHADDAYMFLATRRMEHLDYEAAAADLGTLIEVYPEGEWAYEARYLLGDCWLSLNRGPAYDLDSLVNARTAFEKYIAKVEASPALTSEYAGRLAQAREGLAEVNERLAKKHLLIADFYDSVERPVAAGIYLNAAAANFADTPSGRQAAERTRPAAPGEQ